MADPTDSSPSVTPDSTTPDSMPSAAVAPSREPHGFLHIVMADAKMAAAFREERHEFRSRSDKILQTIRLMFVSDGFMALAAYRLEMRLRELGVPILPWLARRLALSHASIAIADTAIIHPGVVIPDGQVVIHGNAEVQPGASLGPWVTLEPLAGSTVGPTVGAGARIGTGAKVIGDVEVGPGARVGVNAVLLDDVPPGVTVVGVPARPIEE